MKLRLNLCINILGSCKDTMANLRKACKNMKIKLNGKHINQTNNIRFLGLQLQSNNKFNTHIKIKVQKAKRA